jgi:secreted PhoX family phosphatase
MDDGLLVPGAHDGMAAFPGPNGRAILVRNHEMTAENKASGPFGPKNELLARIDRELLYDYARGRLPGLGGTTTLVYDTRTQILERHFLSLAGTIRNCAGGPTPWNTWITCEETVQAAEDPYEQDHGYNFEVPARADGRLIKAVPLKQMGRFNHEAVAVDPETKIVYQTEDRENGLIYRYLPNTPGRLLDGGRLQALRIRDRGFADTRNWGKTATIYQGASLDVEWVDLTEFDVESPDDELRLHGHFGRRCARFARGEGMWYGRGVIYFACTNGGKHRKGQIWRYVPSPYEGQAEESARPGRLELFVEPRDEPGGPAAADIIENCDNLTVAPWGDLFIAEDGGQSKGKSPPGNYLLRITPAGQVYKFARNALNNSELAGPCFSPDGQTLFVNIQTPGLTLAITGPWSDSIPALS